MKIMVAFDTSPQSALAVDEVAQRAWPAGSEVRLVTAAELAMEGPTPLPGGGKTSDIEKIRLAVRAEYVRRIEAAIAKFASRTDLKVTYELRGPGVKSSLLEAIREWSPDLVVAGSHGLTAFGRIFLGSVALALVVNAPCNVEIVKRMSGSPGST